MVTNERDYYIKLISVMSSSRNDLLLKMLDKYGVNSLGELTVQQIKRFYESIK